MYVWPGMMNVEHFLYREQNPACLRFRDTWHHVELTVFCFFPAKNQVKLNIRNQDGFYHIHCNNIISANLTKIYAFCSWLNKCIRSWDVTALGIRWRSMGVVRHCKWVWCVRDINQGLYQGSGWNGCTYCFFRSRCYGARKSIFKCRCWELLLCLIVYAYMHVRMYLA